MFVGSGTVHANCTHHIAVGGLSGCKILFQITSKAARFSEKKGNGTYNVCFDCSLCLKHFSFYEEFS
jgi:hypothetical protein